ncbi:substrate-binding domain-containing protein [Streptomyces sp. NPDC017936]|uniref:substrate-binding domain-containing protein n=1 Tax=Streptomyces sp. NPDC017936 TaxID=3365016 RepID=UPI0037B93892
MKAFIRDAVVAVTAVSAALALTACGPNTATGPGRDNADDAPTIAVLLPDAITARWETQDGPLLEEKIKKLCEECTVEHANAKGEVALQQQQMDSMISKGVDAILLVAVDGRSLAASVRKADEAGIPVIAYDRLAGGPIAGHVSFDGEQVGRLQGTSLLQGMASRAPDDQIVMMNGDPSDPNAALFKKGALSVLTGRVKIGKSYDTHQWRAEVAHMNMTGAIAALGAGNIDGVYAANDSLAAGSISALRANKVAPIPPVTGQDAELAAVRRIVAGRQYMTVYKPFAPEAASGAALAVAAARGENLGKVAEDTVTARDGTKIAAVMLTPLAVTADNIKDTLVKDGVYTVRQICAPGLWAACGKAGLT